MTIGMILDAPFPPDPRVENEAVSLVQAGYQVCLFCLTYGDEPAEEIHEGIRVCRYRSDKLEYKLSANRYALIDQILAVQHKEYREVLYDYHRSGFDNYASDAKKSKLAIREALLKFEKLFRRNQNSFVVRTFFDAKADEIAAVFSDGPEVDTENLFNLLSRISPVNSSKWDKFN